MKNLKYIVLSGLFLFAMSTSVNAQTSLGNAKDKVENKTKEVKNDAEKAKMDSKDRAEKMQKHGQEEVNKAKEGGKDMEEKYNSIKTGYKEKIAKASSDAEKKELEAQMMDELREVREEAEGAGEVIKKGAPNTDDAKDRVKKEASNAKDEAAKKMKEGKKAASENVKMTRDYGLSKAKEAKKNMSQREEALNKKRQLIDKGKSRIRAATDRVDADLASGNITEEEALAKRIKIKTAQERLDRLQSSVDAGKASYEKQKATLNEMYKEEKEN